MGRLIDLRGSAVGPRLVLEPGDVVLVPATGAQIVSGSAVELTGVHQNATPLDDGRIVAPAGAPDVVVLAARGKGASKITLMTGDPFGPSASSILAIDVV